MDARDNFRVKLAWQSTGFIIEFQWVISHFLGMLFVCVLLWACVELSCRFASTCSLDNSFREFILIFWIGSLTRVRNDSSYSFFFPCFSSGEKIRDVLYYFWKTCAIISLLLKRSIIKLPPLPHISSFSFKHLRVPDAFCRVCGALFVFWMKDFLVQH